MYTSQYYWDDVGMENYYRGDFRRLNDNLEIEIFNYGPFCGRGRDSDTEIGKMDEWRSGTWFLNRMHGLCKYFHTFVSSTSTGEFSYMIHWGWFGYKQVNIEEKRHGRFHGKVTQYQPTIWDT